MLKAIKDYCRENCAWLKKEKDVENHAIDYSFNQIIQHYACIYIGRKFNYYKVLLDNSKSLDYLFGVVVIHRDMSIR